MSGPFDKELEAIATQHTQDFARKLAFEVQDLVLRKLGIERASAAAAATVAPASTLRPAPKTAAAIRPAAPKKGVKTPPPPPAAKPPPAVKVAPAPQKRENGQDRATALEQVFRVVQNREGVAVADIVKVTNLERGSVASALRMLKEEGRICMGGSRRFARYAMNQAAADRASEVARRGE